MLNSSYKMIVLILNNSICKVICMTLSHKMLQCQVLQCQVLQFHKVVKTLTYNQVGNKLDGEVNKSTIIGLYLNKDKTQTGIQIQTQTQTGIQIQMLTKVVKQMLTEVAKQTRTWVAKQTRTWVAKQTRTWVVKQTRIKEDKHL